MPFDTTKLNQPTVTVLSPTSSERGGGSEPVHIVIELVEPTPRQRRTGALVFWLLVLLLLATMAHADDQGVYYEHWSHTNGWHSETYRQGTTTDWRAYGPHGEQKHCHSYMAGSTRYTNCN
jgi:hypothetical protein